VPTRTLRGPFPETGNEKLDTLFANAEKWSEIDHDDQIGLVAYRFYVRHPRYPECTVLVEGTMTKLVRSAPGFAIKTGEVKRTITDNGLTPTSAIRELARYSQRVRRRIQQAYRGGRPPGRSEKTHQDYLDWAADYYETAPLHEPPLTQREFCQDREISVRTLQRALRYARNQRRRYEK